MTDIETIRRRHRTGETMTRENLKHALAILALGVVAGCAPMTVEGGLYVSYFRDKQTGCEYIYHFNGGITPRLSPDGTQVCTRKDTE